MSTPPDQLSTAPSCWMRGCMILAVVVPTLMLGLLVYGLIWRTA